MAIYVEAEDVQKRYLNGTLPGDWVEQQIDDAEDILFEFFPRLETSATDKEVKRIKRVVASAVIRYYNNPRGIVRERIEEQEVQLRDAGEDESGLYFTKKELDGFRSSRKRVGMLGVDPAPFAGRDQT
ncbi:head-to-tail adaptor [Gordonia phage BrutonGaster]|uniref:Head-to-tail adaptor n=1 Tax=Gordonia phage BrutonGaster TaxID=2530116 RepID=A0A482JKD8_9CAUD|nr:head-to-tail adaptor [Gordonia phage BrutonGaster]QBP33242.1 head-to-tail adaptor [Gordonia phage BrutonGaster]